MLLCFRSTALCPSCGSKVPSNFGFCLKYIKPRLLMDLLTITGTLFERGPSHFFARDEAHRTLMAMGLAVMDQYRWIILLCRDQCIHKPVPGMPLQSSLVWRDHLFNCQWGLILVCLQAFLLGRMQKWPLVFFVLFLLSARAQYMPEMTQKSNPSLHGCRLYRAMQLDKASKQARQVAPCVEGN